MIEEYLTIAALAYLISTHKASLGIRNWLWDKAVKIIGIPDYSNVTQHEVKNKFWLIVYELVNCPFCCGWWMGLIWSGIVTRDIPLTVVQGLIAGLISAILTKLT